MESQPQNAELKNTLCGFSMGSNQYWARRVYGFVYVFYDRST